MLLVATIGLAFLAAACGAEDPDSFAQGIDPSDEGPAECPAQPAPKGHRWQYDGPEGQDYWGTTDGFANCTSGKDQSPIDIEDPITTIAPNADIGAHAYTDAPGLFFDNGHTMQFLFAQGAPGGTLELDGVTYTLDQFHFHAPSEHRIGGRAFPMEAHFVHSAPSLTPGGPPRRAVIAVMLDVAETPNALVGHLFSHLPTAEGEGTCLQAKGLAATLLAAPDGFYRYDGSLTTPDCSENVSWVVMQTPISVSPDEIGRFVAVFPDNARRVQPLDGRTITFHPGPDGE